MYRLFSALIPFVSCADESCAGHLFHIDFGYILGHDPKPYPPPMKIVEDMIAAMSNVSLFKTYGCEVLS